MGLLGSAAGVVSGLINGKRGIPTPDLTALFKTIKDSGTKQRELIKQLPDDLKPLWDDYIAANQATGQDLTTGTSAIGDELMKKTEANYGPEATRIALDGIKGDIYAELPGQQDAIRQALAATGGFDRGTASKQLSAPILQAAQKYASAAASITAEQLKTKQAATQQAINTIASMDNQALQAVFGMNKEQAVQILNGNRQDLKDQLTDLINQSNNETSQTLSVQGAQVNNEYQKKVAQNAQKSAMTNAWVNLGADAVEGAAGAIGGMPGFLSAINSPLQGAPAGYSPNMAPNQTARLGY